MNVNCGAKILALVTYDLLVMCLLTAHVQRLLGLVHTEYRGEDHLERTVQPAAVAVPRNRVRFCDQLHLEGKHCPFHTH